MKNEKIVKLLQAFTPWDAQEAADVESALRAVRAFDDIASRSNPIVHLCASPWIMSRDMKKVLLVLQEDKLSYVEDFTHEAV